MEIICSSPITACTSLAGWFQCSTIDIKRFLSADWLTKYEQSHLSYKMDLSEYLYNQVSKEFMQTQVHTVTKIHWFHGTRSMYPDSFANGILPLQDIFPCLRSTLDKLAERYGIPQEKEMSENHNHYGFLMGIKMQNDIDKGPCAMLNLDTVKNAANYDCHSYIDIPEIVEDYAHVKYGNNAFKLLDIYRDLASPVIVEFWTAVDDPYNPDIDHIISSLLNYLYAVMHLEQDLLGLHCNTCYSGHGTAIDSGHIIRVNRL